MIGTDLRADPASVRALATWLRSVVSARLDACITAARKSQGALSVVWTDEAGRTCLPRMRQGTRDVIELKSKVSSLALELDKCADDLECARAKVVSARASAQLGGLEVDETSIRPPHEAMPERKIDDFEDVDDDLIRYGELLDVYYDAQQLVNDAVHQLVNRAESFEGEGGLDWQTPVMDTGSFVGTLNGILVDESADRGTGSLRRFRLHLMRSAGPVFDITGVVYDVDSGASPGRAVAKGIASYVGTALGVGAALTLSPAAGIVTRAFVGFAVGKAAQGLTDGIFEEYEPTKARARIEQEVSEGS